MALWSEQPPQRLIVVETCKDFHKNIAGTFQREIFTIFTIFWAAATEVDHCCNMQRFHGKCICLEHFGWKRWLLTILDAENIWQLLRLWRTMNDFQMRYCLISLILVVVVVQAKASPVPLPDAFPMPYPVASPYAKVIILAWFWLLHILETYFTDYQSPFYFQGGDGLWQFSSLWQAALWEANSW